MRVETKLVPLSSTALEIKGDAGSPVRITGYGSVFGEPADSYGDVIREGAYKNTIGKWATSGRSMKMRFNHDPSAVLGKWLWMREDSKGLLMEGEIAPGTRLGEDITSLLRHGSLDGLSIGFYAVGAERRADGGRDLTEIDLREVSIVTDAACERAMITDVKSADIITIRDFESLLVEAHGFSTRAARFIAERGFKAFQSARDERGDASTPLLGVRDEREGGQGHEQRRDGGNEAARVLAALRELRLTPS